MTNAGGRALAGAMSPTVAATRGWSGRAARGWLLGASGGSGLASLSNGASPKGSDGQPGYSTVLPTKVLNDSTAFSFV